MEKVKDGGEWLAAPTTGTPQAQDNSHTLNKILSRYESRRSGALMCKTYVLVVRRKSTTVALGLSSVLNYIMERTVHLQFAVRHGYVFSVGYSQKSLRWFSASF
ncbi:hypothetical protein BaRGS_00028328 [Batillaria attramentaria]|uniref:Uncharacterized protein n=1 Tax=Batillaria attramentaria TaxID=370345 RepID=A0ABD0JZF8_9CAEN